jgi:hypothetical protein
MLATETRELKFDGGTLRGVDGSMPAPGEDGAGSDEVLKALDELDTVLKENAERERALFQRIAQVRMARENGQEWKSILAGEEEPSTVQLVSTILRRRGERLPSSIAGRRTEGRRAEHPEHRQSLRRDAPEGVEPPAAGGSGARGSRELASLGGRMAVVVQVNRRGRSPFG